MSHPVKKNPDRNDRALELFEKGFPSNIIAERLGMTVNYVRKAIRLARERREMESGA